MIRTTTFITLMVCLCTGNESSPASHKHEKEYQAELCQRLDGITEYHLVDKTRVDCLTQEYAIEVDFGKKWAEGIGQSLYYAQMTGRKPAVALIIDHDSEQRYLNRLKKVSKLYGITIFEIQK